LPELNSGIRGPAPELNETTYCCEKKGLSHKAGLLEAFLIRLDPGAKNTRVAG
jgi:hypothetical protein